MIVKNVEKKEHSTAMFQVEVEPEVFEKAVDTAFKRARGSIMVPGFRKGKAPRTVIEGMYGHDVFHDDAVQVAAPDAFEFAVEDAKIENIGAPSIVNYEIGEDKTLTLTFVTDVYPEVALGEYKGLEAEYAEPAVEDSKVDEEIETARRRAARFIDVERPVQQGDTVVFDFTGYVDGEAFEGGSSKDYSLEIGSGQFIPGFEDQMIGMESEKEGEVNVVFPEEYDPKLAGKAAVFKIVIHSVREPELPALDDEFAKDVSEFDTLAEYRQSIADRLKGEAAENSDRGFHSALMVKAIEGMTAEVPESMISSKADEFLRNYADSMGIGGRVSREELLKMIGFTEEAFEQMMRPNAEKQAQADLLLDAIIKAEGIEVSQEDKDEFYKKIDDEYGENAEQVKKMISDELVVEDLARRKAADVIYGSAVKLAPTEKKAEEAAETEENKD